MTGISHETDPTRLECRVDEAGTTILRIFGRLDVHTAAGVWNEALNAMPGVGEAILDASGLTYCDGVSNGGERLVRLQRNYTAVIPIAGSGPDRLVAGWSSAIAQVLTQLSKDLEEVVSSHTRAGSTSERPVPGNVRSPD